LTGRVSLHGEDVAAQDGQASNRYEVVAGAVLDGTMAIDGTCLHNLNDVDSREPSIQATKAWKHTIKKNRRKLENANLNEDTMQQRPMPTVLWIHQNSDLSECICFLSCCLTSFISFE